MKNNQLHLGVLHYHLRFGGVRTVISSALRSLIAFGGFSSLDIDLIASDTRQTSGDSLVNELRLWAQKYPAVELMLRPVQIPELAYNDTPAKDRDQFFREADGLCHRLLEVIAIQQFSAENPYILHVHNPTLGKNPRLTLALKLLAEHFDRDNYPAWLLYQIHDFAEDKRPDRWAVLCQCSGRNDPALAVEMMYPASRKVRWVCLNSSDRRRLVQMGFLVDRVDVLPNPIDDQIYIIDTIGPENPPAPIAAEDFQKNLKNRIADYAQKHGFYFEANRRILLSPVKAIRRKNIAESILLLLDCNSKEDCYQLLVTLPAQSPQDVAYCAAMEEFVKNKHMPVVIGFGTELLSSTGQRQVRNGQVEKYSLTDLATISDAVVTTSIQEGFGYVFHEAWLLGKAVLGRDLPQVTSDFKTAGMNLDHLYTHLLIPQDWLDEKWEELCKAYYEKYSLLRQSADLTICSFSEFQRKLNQKKTYRPKASSGAAEDRMDWADLSLDLQLELLKKIREAPHLIPQLIFTSGDFVAMQTWKPSDLSAVIKHNREIVGHNYGLESYACRFRNLISHDETALLQAEHTSDAVEINHAAMLEQFTALENLRLLV
jgi:hypothetical protein